MDYSKAGVDIAAGDDFAKYIAGLSSPALASGLGGFAGATELDLTGYSNPMLLSTTDGVGTKLLVAQMLGRFNTIGIDLVAMCVNDLLVAGARPLQFLDYIACGRLADTPAREIIDGVIDGCEQAGCVLAGGETAEMPGVYDPGEFDLAGFAVGVAERDRMWPQASRMAEGDLLYAFPSSGIHSNGLSLARKALERAPGEPWEDLLTPTRIYAGEFDCLRELEGICGAAHITGGGIRGNVERILPGNLAAKIDWAWTPPEIFSRIKECGKISIEEMYRVFNMGVGIVTVVKAHFADSFESDMRDRFNAFRIGMVIQR